MLTIVGGGPGQPELLTRAAEDALDRAEVIWTDASIRSVLAGRPHWLGRAESPPSGDEIAQEMESGEKAWVVPGTPMLCPQVHEVLKRLPRSQWQYVRLVSGLPEALVSLDQEGWMVPARGALLLDDEGQELLQWKDHRWGGPLQEERINWRRERPLNGRKVAILRSGGKSQRVVRWLEAWGAETLVCPVSRLIDPPSWAACDRAISRVERFDWIVFTSGEAVERWFERMRRFGQDVRRLRAKIAVVGPETAVRVRERGLVPEIMPEAEYSQEGLAEALSAVPMRGAVVLFPGGQKNRTFLGDYLRGRGALVEELVIYENQPAPLELSFYQALKNGTLDGILFTASSQVEYLMDQLTVDDRREMGKVPSFSIGPLTTRTLAHYGLWVVAEASEPSLYLLAKSVKAYFEKENGPHVSH